MRASLADPSWHELNDANNSNKTMKNYTKFMFSKMATKIDEIFTGSSANKKDSQKIIDCI